MEITIMALSALKRPCEVRMTTDSKYLCDGMQKGWAASWKKRGWRRSDNSPALNPDLWDRLLNLVEKHSVEINWVKGHEGHPENERCDRLAVSESQKYVK